MAETDAGARVVGEKEASDSEKVGLCASCTHCRTVTGVRSVFVMCERAADDPSFARYPRLPVHTCRGYELQDSFSSSP